jgi:nucleoside-diphosphate-sugar epimerase
MKNVLITGANGFVGRALCDKMVADGLLVRGTIRSTSHAVSLLAPVSTVLIDSVDGNTDWSASLKGVDTVVHLAARAHVMQEYEVDSLAAFRRINVAGTERLARQAATAGVKRFIYLSSVKVNGEESSSAYTENVPPSPRDPYGKSKWEAEQVLLEISASTGIEVVIIRPPLVYGPAVKANFLQLMKIVNRGIPLPFASLKNRRSMIYLENLVNAIMICAIHPKAAGAIFLVSDNEDISTPELIRRIAAKLGKTPRLLPCPPMMLRLAGKLSGRSAEAERLLGSLTVDTIKIRRELGWKPPYSMEQGLKNTVEWFKNSAKF